MNDSSERPAAPLDGVQIQAPCSASWQAMDGDDRQRSCEQCALSVHNLTAYSRPEAEALVTGSEGRLCLRIVRDRTGRVLTREDMAPRKRRRSMRRAAGWLCLFLGLPAAGCESTRNTVDASPDAVPDANKESHGLTEEELEQLAELGGYMSLGYVDG